MKNSISDKLKIKKDYTLLPLNALPEIKKGLQGLPAGLRITTSGKDYNQVHWFVFTRAQMEEEMSKVMKLLKPEVVVWVYYPKGTSKLQTDLTRDKGWVCLLAEGDILTWISLISFNDTWSTFGSVQKQKLIIRKKT